MGAELQFEHVTTGATLYAIIMDSDGDVWTGSAFGPRVVADWATYAVALAETPSGGYHYEGDMPAAIGDPGIYDYLVCQQVGASPAISDPRVGAGQVVWDGSAETPPVITPSTPPTVTGYLIALRAGVRVAGAVVTCTQLRRPVTALGVVAPGYAYDAAVRSATSNALGIVEFTGLSPGATYKLTKGTQSSEVTIPVDATDPYELPSLLG
jgi:hypothetical protein